MRSLSAIHQYSIVSTNAAPVKDGDWKMNLALKFRHNQHERSPRLENLIQEYFKSDVEPFPYMGQLLLACMTDGEDRILNDLLENGNIETLTMQGPTSENGWETFAKAMPSNFAVKKLTLSRFCLSASEAGHFFGALGQMAPRAISLSSFSTKSSLLFVSCPPLQLDSLEVYVGLPTGFDDDSCSLPLKILRASKVENFSLTDTTYATVDQFRAVGKALQEKVELKSLKLEGVISKNVLPCFMPFISMKTRLEQLDMSNFNFGHDLIEVLAENKSDLRGLMLNSCSLELPEGDDGRSLFEHLSRLSKLVSLSLNGSWLDDHAMVPLLKMIEKRRIGLLHVHLNQNPIGSGTVNALLSLLNNTRLLSVEVKHDSFYFQDGRAMDELVEAAKRNTALRVVGLPGPESAWLHRVTPYLERNKMAAVAGGEQPGIGVIQDDVSGHVHSNLRPAPTERDSFLDTRHAATNYGTFRGSNSAAEVMPSDRQ